MTEPTGEPRTSPSDRFFGSLRSLGVQRSSDKWFAGVCSGIAQRLGVDPVLVRAVFVLLFFFGGIGVTAYLIAWALLPNDRGEIVAERAVRGGDFWGIVLLVVIAIALFGGLGFAGNGGWHLWLTLWVLVPVVVLVWIVAERRHGRDPAQSAQRMGEQARAWGQQMSEQATAQSSQRVGEQTTAVVPSAPRRPPRAPRRRTAGFSTALLTGGLALAAYGILQLLHGSLRWHGDGGALGMAAALAVAGVITLACGLLGRRAGLTALITLVLAVVTWVSLVIPGMQWRGGVGDRVWTPSSAQTHDSYHLTMGQGVLDLRRLPSSSTGKQVDAHVNVGELRVVVPNDLTVKVTSDVGAGDIRQIGAGGTQSDGTAAAELQTRSWRDRRASTTMIFGTGSPDVVVSASVGLGDVSIERSSQ